MSIEERTRRKEEEVEHDQPQRDGRESQFCALKRSLVWGNLWDGSMSGPYRGYFWFCAKGPYQVPEMNWQVP